MLGTHVRSDHPDRGEQNGGIVGETEQRQEIGNEVERQDKICKRKHERRFYLQRRCPIEGAIIRGQQILGKRKPRGQALDLGPELAAHVLLVATAAGKPGCIPGCRSFKEHGLSPSLFPSRRLDGRCGASAQEAGRHNARHKLGNPSPRGRVAAERSEAVGWGELERTARSSRFRTPHPASPPRSSRGSATLPFGEGIGVSPHVHAMKVCSPCIPARGRRTMRRGRQGGCVRSSVPVANKRRVLCVFPHYTPAFGTFNHAYRLMKGVRAFMPPQGLLVTAAYMPQAWPVRFIDENIRKATAADFAWADAVLVSGMHVQAAQIHDIAARAHAAGKVVMLGGPSASASPEMYPDIDYLHIGEIGDATDQLIARLDESVARPSAQLRLETKDRLPLQDFPIPAYDLIPLKNYLMLTLQFSSGCPYLCEFCDIPNLYGRQPRLKTPAQVTAELDAMRKQKGHPPVVYFVDDNFIGNRKAAKDMLPHLL